MGPEGVGEASEAYHLPIFLGWKAFPDLATRWGGQRRTSELATGFLRRLLKPGEGASLETGNPAGGRGLPGRDLDLGWSSLWRPHVLAGVSGGEKG